MQCNCIASELLVSILDWKEKDSEKAIKFIQTGLDDYEATISGAS